MPRRMLHTLHALGVALSLLTVGLIASTPVRVPGAPARAVADIADTASPAAETQPQTRPVKTTSGLRRARVRESMALPFFSFAQGLRSGNGS
ncbi:MAG: hypothetical protein ACOY82_11650 [Pseudomonadota bacterium]